MGYSPREMRESIEFKTIWRPADLTELPKNPHESGVLLYDNNQIHRRVHQENLTPSMLHIISEKLERTPDIKIALPQDVPPSP